MGANTSDEALGCLLQQVQPIRVGNLKGTWAYDRLRKAYEKDLPPPCLVPGLSSKNVKIMNLPMNGLQTLMKQ